MALLHPRYEIVSIDDLKIGMYIQDVGRSWLRHPWLKKSRLVTSTAEIKKLKEYGITEVVINRSLGVIPALEDDAPQETDFKSLTKMEKVEDIEKRTGVREEVNIDETIDTRSLEEELPAVQKKYAEAFSSTRVLVEQVHERDYIDAGNICRTVENVLDSVCRNKDAFLALSKVRVYEKYDYAHPLLVSVVAVSFGRYIGFSKPQLRELGIAAILQDLGKKHLPRSIVNKPDELTTEEFNIVKKHTIFGAKMVEKFPGLTRQSLMAVLYHHERADGGGYPKGLSKKDLHPYIIVNGLSDVFDALTSDKVYRKGSTPHQALGELYQERGRLFPAEWIERFIHCIGIYPVGTAVELNTGEIGVVTSVNHSQLLRPKITVITDSQGRPLARVRKINLNSEAYLKRSIKTALDHITLSIDPSLYIEPM